MSLSTPFINRPAGTTLMTIAVGLAGALAYILLPVSPLPQVDFPTISVNASLPGASPETMASSVATPLERQFGRIAGVTEMTSSSTLGNTSITMQFDLNRNIDAAARDVQAAINASRGQLPTNLPNNPTYRKVNPADSPIMILAVTSDVYDKAHMYDAASSILQQKLSQIEGVGQVNVGGGALPAVRVEVNPMLLNSMGLGLDDVRNALANANTNRPKGQVSDGMRSWSLASTDQLFAARDYQPLIVAYRNGAPVPLSNVANVVDSVEDVRTAGIANGKPAVLIIISRQPGANIIDTVDRVRALLPELQSQIQSGMKLSVVLDRTTTIRASVHDVEYTLVLSLILVVLVVFVFLRDLRTTLIPSVAVPISLIGTFGIMYLCNYSLDNLSLMALTIATGFVVDDAIVVIENITRHLEEGATPMNAALQGAKEIGFTVVSISVSLVAVFIPLLLMGGIVGRLLREFAVTLSVAIGVSMIVSLTTTPMMCAALLKSKDETKHGRLYKWSEAVFDGILGFYRWSLSGVLRHPFITLMVTLGTCVMTVYLYTVIPWGFFPQQDTGRLNGNIQADQDASFQSVNRLLSQYGNVLSQDPAVDNVIGFAGGNGGGGGTPNTARMFITLKPLEERKINADQVMARLRGRLAPIPGATIVLSSAQDISTGGRRSAALYQYTLRGDSLDELQDWAPKVLDKLKSIPGLLDLNSDQQNRGLQAMLQIDRPTAARLGITPSAIDSALYDAFGQRQVSTIYRQLNQYHVVMEADPKFTQNPDALKYIYVKASDGTQVPLSTFCRYEPSTSPLSVNHQGLYPAVTLSFNLSPTLSLGDAVQHIEDAEREMGLPQTIHGSFAGTAQAFQDSRANELFLVAAALVTVYIVLGILYESLIHPITILSTLPSAGVGALLALLATRTDLSVIALIGIILLIGIVKKNAIMMIDFALEAERKHNKEPKEAIFEACMLRFRPITMTTMAALLGGLPLALGHGTGSELRQPLGIAIVGGLIFSQMLTLYTTPVVYLYLDRLRIWLGHELPAFWSSFSFRKPRPRTMLLLFLCSAITLTLCSCTIGPNYSRPQQHMPTTYRSATTQEATTEPALTRDWWQLFGDPTLNDLETAAIQANPGLQAAMARVTEARAAANIVQADFYPVVTLDPPITRARTPANNRGSNSSASANTTTTTRIPFDLSYEVDIWGKIRRNYESAVATAVASEYDYEVVLQTLEADVAQDYFTARSLAAQEKILARTVESYRQQVDLTQRGFNAGVVSPIDLAQATAQLQATIAQQLDARRQREEEEHALAILLGRPPVELHLNAKPLDLNPPTLPVGLPADLLRRRPDVAEAEQNLVAANAQIGVAEALFFPSVSLTGLLGYESFDVRHSLDWENRAWSVGAGLSQPIFEASRLTGGLQQVKARYLELQANYRTAVLASIRDVEDALVELHIRADESTAQQLAVNAAEDYLRLSQTQYRQGLTNYLVVIDAERTLQSNEIQAAQILNSRLDATVLLIKALGGGWEAGSQNQAPTTGPSSDTMK